ncbi:GtrA family protein [Desulfovibrio aerotolerans]|uniref:GtrA family protein n=1 Tax=Solidesulfovibrio aerotolerans TaxID=295255 RepID=A0A7C9IP00_9BACT|nr:GtrA family protein [Solidesulfovibrio aerotolerans]MYL85204.1 GtrA family protein [Solidesulfovibrio aerotolerans]
MNIKEFILFAISGGLAALVNIGSRMLLSLVLPYAGAICVAYVLGMLSAFLLFKFFVFRAKRSARTGSEVFYFLLVNAISLLLTLGISIGLAEVVFPWLQFTFHAHDIAHIIGVLSPVLLSYVGHKYLTFRKDVPCI